MSIVNVLQILRWSLYEVSISPGCERCRPLAPIYLTSPYHSHISAYLTPFVLVRKIQKSGRILRKQHKRINIRIQFYHDNISRQSLPLAYIRLLNTICPCLQNTKEWQNIEKTTQMNKDKNTILPWQYISPVLTTRIYQPT